MRKGTAFRKGKTQRKTIRQVVFEIVKGAKYGVDTHEVARLAGRKIHSISGRLSELEQEGVIYQKARVYKELRQSCTVWQVTPKELIEARRVEVQNRRLERWMNAGVKNGFVSRVQASRIKAQPTLF